MVSLLFYPHSSHKLASTRLPIQGGAAVDPIQAFRAHWNLDGTHRGHRTRGCIPLGKFACPPQKIYGEYLTVFVNRYGYSYYRYDMYYYIYTHTYIYIHIYIYTYI